jgi:hypothetical protein
MKLFCMFLTGKMELNCEKLVHPLSDCDIGITVAEALLHWLCHITDHVQCF